MGYFKQHNIKSITFQGNEVLIEYQNSIYSNPILSNSHKLQEIKTYAEKLGKSKLTLSDLEQGSNRGGGDPKDPKKPTNFLPWILLVIVILLVIGIIIYLLTKNNKKSEK